jgi:transcriptional regulator with XRE-family HTH domain
MPSAYCPERVVPLAGTSGVLMTSLRRERERRGWSQEEVADRLRQLDPSCGIDANTVSRHERGLHVPRASYRTLYADLYGSTVHELWPPGTVDDMDRRRFLQAIAATSTGALLDGGPDDLEALQAITAGLRSLEPTTPSGMLWGPVTGHLRLVGDRAARGPRYAREAAEVARLAAWLAWDQEDHHRAGLMYQRAIGYARQSRDEATIGFMEGSRALWMAETGRRSLPLRQTLDAPGPWFSTMRATVASAAGDADLTITALKDAEHQARSPLDHQKLLAYTGRAYLRLGLHKAGATALHEAVDGMPSTKYKGVLLAELARVVGEERSMILDEARQLGQRLQSRRVLAEV